MKSLALLYYMLHVLIQSCLDHNPNTNKYRYEVLDAICKVDDEVTLEGKLPRLLSAERLHEHLGHYKIQLATCRKREICPIAMELKEYIDLLIASEGNITRGN